MAANASPTIAFNLPSMLLVADVVEVEPVDLSADLKSALADAAGTVERYLQLTHDRFGFGPVSDLLSDYLKTAAV